VWQALRGGRSGDPVDESVHTQEFPVALDLPQDDGIETRFARLLETREVVLKALETAARGGTHRNSLEAHVVLRDGERLALLQRYAGFLEDLFIVSGVTLGSQPATAVPGGEDEPLSVSVERAGGRKCERCWHIRKDVGQDAEFKTVCARCVRAVQPSSALGGRGCEPLHASPIAYALLTLSVLLLDQTTKAMVVSRMTLFSSAPSSQGSSTSRWSGTKGHCSGCSRISRTLTAAPFSPSCPSWRSS